MGNEPEMLSNPAGVDELFDLGRWLGRRQAFALVASKTAAAEVECLRQIRDGNLYRAKGVDWAEFCQKYAGVTSVYANRLIRELDELGPSYFDLSRIMRISANTYRQIAGSVSEDGITFGGEKIAISPENSDKLAEAVKALREQSITEGIPGKPAGKNIAGARRRLKAAVVEMTHLFEDGLEVGEREELVNAVSASMGDLRALSLFMGG
jgi:hypothetical protein